MDTTSEDDNSAYLDDEAYDDRTVMDEGSNMDNHMDASEVEDKAILDRTSLHTSEDDHGDDDGHIMEDMDCAYSRQLIQGGRHDQTDLPCMEFSHAFVDVCFGNNLGMDVANTIISCLVVHLLANPFILWENAYAGS